MGLALALCIANRSEVDNDFSLPAWALWIIAAAVGLGPGLAFVMVRPISRFSHRTLWVRSNGARMEHVGGDRNGCATKRPLQFR